MDAARAFSPGHVTGFFSIHPHDDPLRHGSTGAGFSLAEGTVTSLSPGAEDRVLMNGQPLDGAPVSRAVLRLFRETTGLQGTWTVAHRTSLPIGCGFGTSGAGALSLALALNEAAGSPLARLDAAALAHRAELEAGTGLGTVLGETYGGFEVRTVAGAPGTGTVVNLPYDEGLRAVFLVFGPRATPVLLGDGRIRAAVSREGESLRQRLLDDPGVAQFLALSRTFGRQADLVPPRLAALQDRLAAEGLVAPMLMFGDGLFTLVDLPTLDSVLDLFRRLAPDARVFGSALDRQGGRNLVRP
jgi:pantoate kinase